MYHFKWAYPFLFSWALFAQLFTLLFFFPKDTRCYESCVFINRPVYCSYIGIWWKSHGDICLVLGFLKERALKEGLLKTFRERIYSFGSQELDLSPTGLLPPRLQWRGLSQAEARSFTWGCHVGGGSVPSTQAILLCFSQTVSRGLGQKQSSQDESRCLYVIVLVPGFSLKYYYHC